MVVLEEPQGRALSLVLMAATENFVVIVMEMLLVPMPVPVYVSVPVSAWAGARTAPGPLWSAGTSTG